MPSRERPRKPEITDDVIVVGGRRPIFRDLYHAFLGMSWPAALSSIVGCYLVINVLFAEVYRHVGGVVGMRPGSFADAFNFSIQTMGTIGYGAMYPAAAAANAVVAAQSVAGLLVTALATGLVFAKFSRTTSRVVFTRHAVIAPMDGVATLMFRVGNERSNFILEAQVHVVLMRTERTREGQVFYRMYDLELVRDRSSALSRSWTVLHRIVAGSPLHGETAATLKQKEAELVVDLIGLDDVSMQTVHGRQRYVDQDILWDSRHADILSERPDGKLILDLRKFHDVVPVDPPA